MSLDESHFIDKADIHVYKERITINEKMMTKLTLEQNRWILNVITRLNRYLKTKAKNFYRYDDFSGSIRYDDEKNRL